jgi:hypothetical protein
MEDVTMTNILYLVIKLIFKHLEILLILDQELKLCQQWQE